jgi:hypothetical protein
MSEDDENLWFCLRQSRASSCVRTVLGFNAWNKKIKNAQIHKNDDSINIDNVTVGSWIGCS